MSPVSILEEIPEALGLAIHDRAGALVAQQGEIDGAALSGALVEAVAALCSAGETLGLGALEGVGVQSVARKALTLVRDQLMATVFAPPGTPWKPLETRLAALPWETVLSLAAPAEPRVLSDQAAVAPEALAPAGASWSPEPPPDERPGLDELLADLRRALARAELERADELGHKLGECLDEGQAAYGDCGQASPSTLVWAVIEGVRAIARGDSRAGLETLRPATAASFGHLSLRWVAALWSARAAIAAGEIDVASGMAQRAVEHSATMGSEARAQSLLALAQSRMMAGDTSRAQQYLSDARLLLTFDNIDDRDSLAAAALLEARLLATWGSEEACIRAGLQALALRPAWREPVVFLVRRFIRQGQPGAIEELLRSIPEESSGSAEVARERKLMQLIEGGVIPRDVVARLYQLQEAPPSRLAIGDLQLMMQQVPQLLRIQEALAWKLFQSGRRDEARQHFEALEHAEDVDVAASARRGLQCLASRA